MATLTDLWRSVEALHDVVYFVPGAEERYAALGLRGYWMGYFASRAGALGEVSADVVTATFHGFAPHLVARAVPDCWRMADRTAVLAERTAIAVDALAGPLGAPTVGHREGHDVHALAAGLASVLHGADLAGKPLAAAHLGPAPSADPVGELWRLATVLRELRGDCHVALLVGAGLGGCAANALQVAVGRGPARQRLVRGWTEEEWTAALESLADRGWVEATTGAATTAGHAFRDELERATDRACAAALSPAARVAAEDLGPPLLAAARAVAASGVIPYPNPVGVPAP